MFAVEIFSFTLLTVFWPQACKFDVQFSEKGVKPLKRIRDSLITHPGSFDGVLKSLQFCPKKLESESLLRMDERFYREMQWRMVRDRGSQCL